MIAIPTVFVEEEITEDASRLLGTFAAAVRLSGDLTPVDQAAGLALDDALAWGRQRSGRVLVRFGQRTDWSSAGPTPHWSYRPWPPPDLPLLVPRPTPPPRWRKSNVVNDAGLQWAVTVWLTPEDLSADAPWELRETWRAIVAAAASESRAQWDGHSLDAFLADARGAHSFFTMPPAALRVHLVVDARDRADACATAAAAFDPPAGFRARWSARPADLDDPIS